MYKAQGKSAPKEMDSTVLYNRGVLIGALHVEAVRNAIKAKGGAAPTSEEVKKGMESVKDFTLGGLVPPMAITGRHYECGAGSRSGPSRAASRQGQDCSRLPPGDRVAARRRRLQVASRRAQSTRRLPFHPERSEGSHCDCLRLFARYEAASLDDAQTIQPKLQHRTHAGDQQHRGRYDCVILVLKGVSTASARADHDLPALTAPATTTLKAIISGKEAR